MQVNCRKNIRTTAAIDFSPEIPRLSYNRRHYLRLPWKPMVDRQRLFQVSGISKTPVIDREGVDHPKTGSKSCRSPRRRPPMQFLCRRAFIFQLSAFHRIMRLGLRRVKPDGKATGIFLKNHPVFQRDIRRFIN